MPSKFKKPKIKRSNPEALNNISKTMKKTGFVEAGVVEAEKKDGDDTLTVADVASFNEFGTEVIPERSFMRSTMKDKKRDIANLSKKILPKILKGKMTPAVGLGLLGEFVSDEIRQKIVDIKDPPNAPSTLRAKAPKTNPLLNTDQMKNAITYEVKSGSIK